jgi:hypothetical protein
LSAGMCRLGRFCASLAASRRSLRLFTIPAPLLPSDALEDDLTREKRQ